MQAVVMVKADSEIDSVLTLELPFMNKAAVACKPLITHQVVPISSPGHLLRSIVRIA